MSAVTVRLGIHQLAKNGIRTKGASFNRNPIPQVQHSQPTPRRTGTQTGGYRHPTAGRPVVRHHPPCIKSADQHMVNTRDAKVIGQEGSPSERRVPRNRVFMATYYDFLLNGTSNAKTLY